MGSNMQILHGNIVENVDLPAIPPNPTVMFTGKFKSRKAVFGIDENIMGKHMLLVGGTGCGKTNLFYFFVDQVRKKLTKDDVMIIFDSKGDFFNRFFEQGDLLISNSKHYTEYTSYWNIFKEIVADGWDYIDIEMNTHEITRSLFREAIEKNATQPFFPNAARDLLSAILIHLIRIGQDDLDFKRTYFNNQSLKKYFDTMTAAKIIDFLEGSDDLRSVLSYIGDGTSGQSLGVIAELQNVVREIFIGAFAKNGMFSVRNFVRNKGGKVLFIEYDLAIGSVLTPIYRLLFDLALREALGRNKTEGQVYFICDEFKLLPYLQHVEDGLNFGRSLGVKIIAGLQSIEQLFEIYGPSRGKNIAAGFSSVFAFKANDVTTRNYISDLYGKNIVIEQHKLLNNNLVEEKRSGNTVEDWDMNSLAVGEALVGLPFAAPFKFHFELYR